MKIKSSIQFFNLLAFVAVMAITTIKTTAQTSVRPVVNIMADTASRQQSIESFEVLLTADNNEKFLLSINNPFKEKLRISITTGGNSGFSDVTKELSYRKLINMSGAEDGNYTVTIIGDKKIFSKTIHLQTVTEINRNLTID